MLTTAVLGPVAEARWKDDEPLYEIIDGQRVELPPMSAYAMRVASRLLVKVEHHVSARGLGEVVMETLFAFPPPMKRNRRFDLAFVSYERWPKSDEQPLLENAWEVVPNLGIEVISTHDYAYEILDRMEEFFKVGVNEVWIVYPVHRLIHVCRSLRDVVVFGGEDELTGSKVLPDFKLPLADLFLHATS